MSVMWLDGFDHYQDADDAATVYANTGGRVLGSGRTVGQALYAGGSTDLSYEAQSSVENPTDPPSVTFAPTSDATVGCGFLPGYDFFDDDNASGVAFRRNADAQIMVEFRVKDRRVIVYDFGGGTVLAQSDFRWVPGRWYFLEFKVTGDSSSGAFEVRINEQTILSATNVPTTSSDGLYDEIVWGHNNTYGPICAVDDLYVLDNTQSGASGFLGDLVVTGLVPNADRNVSWAANPDGDHYANVDDGSNLNDADYNESDVAGAQDVYELSDLSTNPAEIPAINILARVQKDVAGTRSAKIGSEGADGTQNLGDAFPLSTEWEYHSMVQEKTPSGDDWTPVTLNGLGYVIEAV